MLKFVTRHGDCWIDPEYVKAIYPLEAELSMSEGGLAEIKCYLALENGETLELVEAPASVHKRWANAKKEAPKEA